MHAALACYTSEFERCVYITADGGGDQGDPRDFVFGYFDYSNNEQRFTDIFTSKSGRAGFGGFHDQITDFMGFSTLQNGKTTGVAAFGDARAELINYFTENLRDGPAFNFPSMYKGVSRSDVSKFKIDRFKVDSILNPAPGNTRLYDDLKSYRLLDVAASAEEFLSLKLTELINKLLKLTDDYEGLAFAGGLFNNVRLNKKLVNFLSTNSWFTMAPGDAGLSLGGLLHEINKVTYYRQKSPLIGPRFSTEEVRSVLEEMNVHYQECFNKNQVIEDLASGAIVGFFEGNSEFGPRSLGARSILADPRDSEVIVKVNQYAKRRDFFMPFAPAIMDEELPRFLKRPETASDYMQVACEATDEAFKLIPAAVHVDGTMRVQRVTKSSNPDFYELITLFRKKTGIGAILNTSFNRHGISTISTPRQAIEHFLSGTVDSLYIDGYYAQSKENSKRIRKSVKIAPVAVLLEQFEDVLRIKHESLR